MTLQTYTHVRNSSVDSTDIHKDLSRMPSFIMEDEHTKWGRLKTKISKIFTKEDIPELIPTEFFDNPQPKPFKVLDIESQLARNKAGMDRAKSFKKAKDLPIRRKTSLPGPQRQLSKKWTKSRHTPSHPPVVGKSAHPLSFICSSQNPLISLPSTMSATLDQLEEMRQDSISVNSCSSSDGNDRVHEWINDSAHQQPPSPSTSLSSFGNESDISWTPFKSQPSMPTVKQQEQFRASWNAYPNHVPSVPLQYRQSDASLTIVDRSNVTSEVSTPVWSAINSNNNSVDDLKGEYKSLNSFNFKKRSSSIGLTAAIEKALPNSSMYALESLPKSKAPLKCKTCPKTMKSREFGLLEALEMEEDDYGMDSDGESIIGERQLTFMEALMEMEPLERKMQVKEAGFVPKILPNINSDYSTSHRGTQSTDIRDSMDIYSDIYCSSELIEFDDLYFGDEQNVYIVT